MKSKLIAGSLLATALFAGIGISPVMAQGTNTPNINQAQQEISARIQQGLASGQITPSEGRYFYQREREIQVRENRFKSDGFASAQERQQLRQDLDALRDEVEYKLANRAEAPRQPDRFDRPDDRFDRPDDRRPDRSDATPGIDNRMDSISDRIEEGVRSGRITKAEARSLQRRERRIERQQDRFKADGVVTLQERRQLRDDLTALSNEVERLMRRRARY